MKLGVLAITFFSMTMITASAYANCANDPHGFDCQLDVLEGDDAGGRVIPLIAFPSGKRTWKANLFVNGNRARVNPPIQTIVQRDRHIRTCGIEFNGRGGMSIETKVEGHQIQVTLKKFRGGRNLVYDGEIVDGIAQAQFRKSLFSPQSVFEVVRCSVFNRVGNAHLSCAIFAVSENDELLPLGILGGILGGNPSQCKTSPTERVVL